MPALEQVKVETAEEWLTVEEVLTHPVFRHLKASTLASWRKRGRGPLFIVKGRKVFYRKAAIDSWLIEEEKTRERLRKVGEVALPFQGRRRALHSVHRLGGHKTKRERRQESGGPETS